MPFIFRIHMLVVFTLSINIFKFASKNYNSRLYVHVPFTLQSETTHWSLIHTIYHTFLVLVSLKGSDLSFRLKRLGCSSTICFVRPSLLPSTNVSCLFVCFLWRCGPTRAMASSFLRFLDHTQ